jgi:fumarylacetoacetate (FAA) hydrolase
MKLATLRNGRPDGLLAVVSHDLTKYVSAGRIAPNLQAALDSWDTAHPALQELSVALNTGRIAAQAFDSALALAPLPRAYQWIDGAAYLGHLERVRGIQGTNDGALQATRPLLYQGASDQLSAATDPILVVDDNLAVDFEAEIVVVTGPVPMQPSRAQAVSAIRLVGICNDVSLRRLVAEDLQDGFGFFHSKPSTAFSPVFVTPDELAPAWRAEKLHLPVRVSVNGKLFGQPNAGVDMHFDFADLILAAARTRSLGTGTLIGSGTIANAHEEGLATKQDSIGFACIVEARTVEKLKYGRARTPFLKAGDRVSIAALDAAGHSVFGTIDQTVTLLKR